MSYFKNMAFYIGYGYDRVKNAEAVEKFLQLQGYRSDKDETTNKKYRDQHAFIYGYNYIIADCNGLYYFSSKDYNYPSHSIPNQKPKAMKKLRMKIVKVVAWVTDFYHVRRGDSGGSYPAYTAYINTYFFGFLISSVQIRDIEPYDLELMLGDNAEIKPLK